MSIVSGIYAAEKGSQATKSAADTAASAQNNATAMAKQIYDAEVQRMQPFYEAGKAEIPTFEQMLSGNYSMNESPAARYELEKGTKALVRAEAARGLTGSGSSVNRLAELNRSVAASDWNQQYNRILDALKLGTGASASMGSSGNALTAQSQQGATNLGNIFTQEGKNQASLYAGYGGLTSNAASTGINAYSAYKSPNYNTAKVGAGTGYGTEAGYTSTGTWTPEAAALMY